MRQIIRKNYVFLHFHNETIMSTAQPITVIINPISGTGSKERIPALVEKCIDPGHNATTVVFTQSPGHATELAREALSRGDDGVVAVGGDGTVNEVARVLRGTGVPLAVVPCGSGNGLARHLHIPINVEKALAVINDGNIETVDCGTVNGLPFFCTCGVGFDAQVSYKFANEDTRGLVTYIRATLGEYFRYKAQDYAISIDNQQLRERAFVIAFCNAAQYGNNAFMAPRASMKDGMIDMTVIHSFNLGEAALLSARLFTSSIDHDRHVTIYRGRDIYIEREKDDVMHLDGEPMMMPRLLHIECQPAALRVFVPKGGKSI